ncbi:MAG: hypothetical protein ACRDZN_01040 [Acidimicrobiales bacterium]
MAAEMPTKVEAVTGAIVVDFPWTAASAAVTALQQASSTLGTQLESRATMLPTIVDWAGTYRDEFDRAYHRLTTTAASLKETLTSLGSSIVSGAEDANQRQRAYNTAALEPDPDPPTTTNRYGRNIPV